MEKPGLLHRIANYWSPLPAPVESEEDKRQRSNQNRINNRIAPLQLARLRQDISSWRQAIHEAEMAYFPYRVRMQQLFQDTILNGHVSACIARRQNLTLLKEFHLCNEAGETNEEVTKLFKAQWFYNTQKYILDAPMFGYTLINFLDIMDDKFSGVEVIRRAHVSPDRLEVTSYPYMPYGTRFDEGEIADWCLYIPTPSDLGVSRCGYGLLYKVAPYEIYLRAIQGFNADYIEVYGQPFRHGKTLKKDGPEKDAFVESIRDMGSSAWAVTDPDDQIEFKDGTKAGTGWQSYDNFEKRNEQKISKILLGHADALDQTSGKLGSGQGGENSATAESIREVQNSDKIFMECIINDQLLPKMRRLGFPIPEGVYFKIKNDDERQELRNREDASNKVTAEIISSLKTAGFKVDAAYITERTGIPVVDAPEPEPAAGAAPFNRGIGNSIRARLEKIYGHKH